MDINWNKVKRVLVNQRPTRTMLMHISQLLPKCKIHGYGYYGFLTAWYLLVEDPSFPENPGLTIPTVPIERLIAQYSAKNNNKILA